MRLIEDRKIAIYGRWFARNCAVGYDYGFAGFVVSGDDAAGIGEHRHVCSGGEDV
jgi:hypothetical protein